CLPRQCGGRAGVLAAANPGRGARQRRPPLLRHPPPRRAPGAGAGGRPGALPGGPADPGALANPAGGVIRSGAAANVLGGDRAEAGNIISGNAVGVGVQDAGTMDNDVLGNYIGLDVTGTHALGNSTGVAISLQAASTTVRHNVISANQIGVDITAGAFGNDI